MIYNTDELKYSMGQNIPKIQQMNSEVPAFIIYINKAQCTYIRPIFDLGIYTGVSNKLSDACVISTITNWLVRIHSNGNQKNNRHIDIH